jgi:hypothetical protein
MASARDPALFISQPVVGGRGSRYPAKGPQGVCLMQSVAVIVERLPSRGPRCAIPRRRRGEVTKPNSIRRFAAATQWKRLDETIGQVTQVIVQRHDPGLPLRPFRSLALPSLIHTEALQSDPATRLYAQGTNRR